MTKYEVTKIKCTGCGRKKRIGLFRRLNECNINYCKACIDKSCREELLKEGREC